MQSGMSLLELGLPGIGRQNWLMRSRGGRLNRTAGHPKAVLNNIHVGGKALILLYCVSFVNCVSLVNKYGSTLQSCQSVSLSATELIRNLLFKTIKLWPAE